MKLCSNRGGVNRVIALLLAAIAVMLVVVLLPAWDDLRLLSQRRQRNVRWQGRWTHGSSRAGW